MSELRHYSIGWTRRVCVESMLGTSFDYALNVNRVTAFTAADALTQVRVEVECETGEKEISVRFVRPYEMFEDPGHPLL